MKNNLLSIGPLTVHGYGLMIAIGVIAAYLAAVYRAKKFKLDPEMIFNLTAWCLAGGLLGAKVLYYITILNDIMKDPKILLQISDGFVVYGGIIGGITAGYLYCRKHKLNFLKYFDLVMPSIALAQGFGRIGCFLAGCCYGVETRLPFPMGVEFPVSAIAPSGVRLVNTELLSSSLDFLHFFILTVIAKRVKADGMIAGFYLMFYSAGRFALEYVRGDLERGSVGSMSTSQFIAIFLFMIGVAIVLIRAKTGKTSVVSNENDSREEEI